jgi:septal ring factor EnvC (AmiA/AmiB activator)
MSEDPGLRERATRQGEETIGKLLQDLLSNPLVTSMLTNVFGAREHLTRAQEVAMGALNLPSAGDIERLTRRVRSVAQRIEGLEDSVDRLEETLRRIEAMLAKAESS